MTPLNANGDYLWATQEDLVRILGSLLEQECATATTQASLQLLSSYFALLTLPQRGTRGRSAQVIPLTALRLMELINPECRIALWMNGGAISDNDCKALIPINV